MKKFFALVLALALTMGLCAVSLPASADDKPVEMNVWLRPIRLKSLRSLTRSCTRLCPTSP